AGRTLPVRAQGRCRVSVSAVSAHGRTFMLPDLGEGLTEAEVFQWHVAPGDEVNVDQVVVTVETAKASVDLPCPYAGFVTALHSEPGAVLEVGKPLLTVGAQQSAGSGNVLVGYGTSPAKRSGRRRVTPQGRPSPARNGGPVAAARAGAPKVISPVVRRLAKDNGDQPCRPGSDRPRGRHPPIRRRGGIADPG